MVAVQHQPQPDAASPVVLVDPATSFDGGFFLAIDELVVDRSIQTRHDRDPDVVAGIFASMKARLERGHHPQEMPAWVTRHGNRWLLLAGFTRDELLRRLSAEMQNVPGLPEEARRWLARPTMWVVHKHAPTPYRAIVENLRENLIRQNLSIADETEAMARLQDLDPTRPLADIAADLDRSTRGTANLLRAYRELSPEMWGAFRRGTLPQRGAIKLAGIKDAIARREAFELLTDPDKRKAAREARAAAKVQTEASPSGTHTPAVGNASTSDEGQTRDAWGCTVDELYTLGVNARHAMRDLEGETAGLDCDAPYLDGVLDVLNYIETADLGVLDHIVKNVRRLRTAGASATASASASAENGTPVPDLQPAASAVASAAASGPAKSGKLHRRDPSGRGARCNYRITDPARLTDDPDLVGCDTCAGRVGYSEHRRTEGAQSWLSSWTTAALLDRVKRLSKYSKAQLEDMANELGSRVSGKEEPTPTDHRITRAIGNIRAAIGARREEEARETATAAKVTKAPKVKPKAARESRAAKKGRR